MVHPTQFPRWLLVTLLLTLLALVLGGIWFYRAQEDQLRQRAADEMLAIARLKVDEITAWRAERLGDAANLSRSPFFIDGVRRWMADPQGKNLEDLLTRLRVLKESYLYDEVILVGVDGTIHLSLSGTLDPIHEVAAQALKTALASRQPQLTDLHRAFSGQPPHIDVVAPLFTDLTPSSEPLGAIILRSDARQFLYPLSQTWPTMSSSAETLLVRRDGDSVLYLNDLRHRENTALALRIPLSETNVPAVRAVLGLEGVLEGEDYRGSSVLAATRAVPGTPWFIVAKMDQAEVFADLRLYAQLVLALILGALAATGTALVTVGERNQKVAYQALFQAEKAKQQSEARYQTTLLSIGDGVIVTDSEERIVLLNPVAEKLTGWSHTEASGKPLAEVFPIVNEDMRHPVENPARQVMREGVVVGLANHTLLISRDGRETPIADSGAPIHDSAGNVTGVVLVFRDQTEERAAQAALREANQKLEILFAILPVGVSVLDNERQVIRSNPELTRILELPADALQRGDHRKRQYFRSDGTPMPVEEFASVRVINGEAAVHNVETGVRKENGEFVWANVSAVACQLADWQVVTVTSDITERKAAAEALLASEAKYHHTLDAMLEGCQIIGFDWRYIYLNDAAVQHSRRTREALLGRAYTEVWPDYETTTAFAAMRRSMEARVAQTLDNEFEFPDGSKGWFELKIYPVPEGIVVLSVDITERRRAEAALRRRESTLNALLNAPLETIALIDTQDNVLNINENGARRLGLTPEALVGQNIYAMLPPAVAQARKPIIDGVLQSGQAVHFEDARAGRHYANSIYPVFDTLHHTLLGVAIYATDITERKLAEQREKHLTAVLRAIRNVSQLIVHEKDPDSLLQSACDNLTDTRGYHTAWIALVDEAGTLLTMKSAHLDEHGPALEARFLRGEWVYCIQHALTAAGALVISDPAAVCGDCPLALTGEGRGRMSVRLEYEGRAYGVLTVSAPMLFVNDREEQGLLEEIAGDLAFALHSVDLERRRREAEAALRESEARYRLLAENMQDTVWLMDMNLKSVYISPSVIRLRGYTLDELNALPLDQQMTPESFQRAMQMLAETLSPENIAQRDRGISRSIELEFYKKDGSTVWSENTFVLIRDEDGNPTHILGSAHDITERKRAEAAEHDQRILAEALRDTAAALNSAVELDAVMNTILANVAHVVPHDAASIMLIEAGYAQAAYLRGYGPDQADALRVFRISVDQTPHLQHMLETRSPYLAPNIDQDTSWVRHPDAEWVKSYVAAPICLRGGVIGFLNLDSAAPDFFTEAHAQRLLVFADQVSLAVERAQLYEEIRRRAAELEQRVEARTAELQKSEARYRAVIEDQTDLVCRYLSDGTLTFVNDAFCDYCQRRPQELLGTSFFGQLMEDERPRLAQHVTLLSHENPVAAVEIGSAAGNGRLRWVHWVNRMLFDGQGGFVEYQSVGRNITEQKDAEAQLQQLLSHEVKLNEIKSRYVSMAAHDLRNPLAAIQMSIETIQKYRHQMTEEQILARYDRVHYSIRVMVEILNDIITIGQAESGKLKFEPQALNLPVFAYELIAELQQLFERTDRIVFSHAGLCDTVQMDPKLLRHILVNLLSNALKYSAADQPVKFDIFCESGQVTFRIQDRGIGVPNVDQKRLFEAFQRASNVGRIPGTGLGLAIVKQSVALHGGTITFESQEGVGTTFIASIPLAPLR